MATVEIAEYQDEITVEVNETYEVITVVVETPTEGETYNDTELRNRVIDLETDVKEKTISYALSSPSADLTAGDTDSFHAPYDFTLVTYFVAVSEAPSGSALVVDVKKNGVSITSSNAIIDSGETTSLTGTAPVLTTTSFLKGDKITPVISQVGALETGKSLKIYLEILKS